MKKVFSLTVALALLLTAAVPANAAHRYDHYSFYDVPSSHTYFVPIDYLRRQGVVSAFDDGSFRPDRFVSRSAFVTWVVRARDRLPRQSDYHNCFVDVTYQSFADEVCYAKSRGWLRNYREYFYPSRTISGPEAFRILSDVYGGSRASVSSNYAYSLTRAQAADSIYRSMRGGYNDDYRDDYYDNYRDDYSYRYDYQYEYDDNGRYKYRSKSYRRVPDGYPDPWAPNDYYGDNYYSYPDDTRYRYDYYPPPSYYSPYSYTAPETTTSGTYIGAVCSLPISRNLSRSAQPYSVNYCPLDNTGVPGDQILLGTAQISNVWGQDFSFGFNDKHHAMGVAYASEMFNVNPNFLLAIAIRESRMNCAHYSDGCFQLGARFFEVKNRFPQYFGNETPAGITQSFGPASLIAALFIRHQQSLLTGSYQWRAFLSSAVDPNVRAKLLARTYHRGLSDPVLTDILVDKDRQCSSASDVLQCFPTRTAKDKSAFDFANAVTRYCQDLMQARNFYETRLTRSDIRSFVDQVVRPAFSRSANVDWSAVYVRLDDAFSCLKDSNNTISFRYDFKIILRELKSLLPTPDLPLLL